MKVDLNARLDQILPRITERAFLSSRGIGNEIACYIFDYPAEHEQDMRAHISWMEQRFASHHSDIKLLNLNLFDVVLDYLSQRKLLDKTLKMQSRKGDTAVLKALRGPLAAEKLRDHIQHSTHPGNYDLVLLSGVGSVWPMMRVHGLLNSLHTIMGTTPLLMFYPGSFDGTTLKLFDRVANSTHGPGAKQYYRAFALVP